MLKSFRLAEMGDYSRHHDQASIEYNISHGDSSHMKTACTHISFMLGRVSRVKSRFGSSMNLSAHKFRFASKEGDFVGLRTHQRISPT
jgi:hypothetical protein